MKTHDSIAQPEGAAQVANNNAELIKGLRACADFLEARPDLPAPLYSAICFMLHDTARFKAAARTLGSLDKEYSTSFFNVRKDFGGGLVVELSTQRENVCKKVVTGTRQVEKTVLHDLTTEDQATLDALQAKRYVAEMVDEDVTEWQCDGAIIGEWASNA